MAQPKGNTKTRNKQGKTMISEDTRRLAIDALRQYEAQWIRNRDQTTFAGLMTDGHRERATRHIVAIRVAIDDLENP